LTPPDDATGLRTVDAPAPAVDAPAPAVELALVVHERRSGWRLFDLAELWHYRELLYFLAWRDVKVRYKQTALGAAWAILQPFATMIVFTLFLGRLVGTSAEGVPYPLFVFTALLPWTFFANAITAASQSLIVSPNLVTKVYFPRVIIPMGTVTAALVDFAVAVVMLLGMMLFYRIPAGWHLLLVPLVMLGLVVTAIGVGSLLAALTVAYRDFRQAIPFMVQIWMFATPTIYLDAARVASPRWLPWLPLNPAYGLIANFRAAALGQPLDVYALTVSACVGVLLLLAGCLYFRRVEQSFADVI
jgi:lipopolysaccharide transport system permease protein